MLHQVTVIFMEPKIYIEYNPNKTPSIKAVDRSYSPQSRNNGTLTYLALKSCNIYLRHDITLANVSQSQNIVKCL
jgi:hypothetical protein